MKLTKIITVGVVAVLLTVGVAATGAVVPGVPAQQEEPDDGPDEEPTEEDEADDETDEDEADDAGPLVVDSLDAPDSAAPGDNVSVAATISNDGEATTERVEFRLGGTVVDRQLVSLAADESTTVTFTVDAIGAEPGDVRHGVFTESDGQLATLTVSESFALQGVDAPESVDSGENVSVTATVANRNDFNTTQPVTFRLEGETVDRENVTIPGGDTATVNFTLSTEGVEPGTYVHSVFTRDTGQFLELEVTEPGPETAAVTFDDQESDGTTVTVQNVTVPSDGYVAIHNDSLLDGDAVGSVVGVSEYLEEGQYDDVTVQLFDVPGATFNETELTENGTLIAMPHNETTGDETYDFVSSNGTDDPPFLADGEAVTDDATVTVATDTPEDNETEDNETDTPEDNETEEPATDTPEDNETEDNETDTPADNETEETDTDTPEDGGAETPTVVGPAGPIETGTPTDNETATETPA